MERVLVAFAVVLRIPCTTSFWRHLRYREQVGTYDFETIDAVGVFSSLFSVAIIMRRIRKVKKEGWSKRAYRKKDMSIWPPSFPSLTHSPKQCCTGNIVNSKSPGDPPAR